METKNRHPHKNKIHRILAFSYLFHFILFLIGICLDLVFKFRIFNDSFVVVLGIIFLMFGTFLVLWAQKTSRNLKKENISKGTFYHGPYRYTRTPTHFGLFFLILGFGIIMNALFIVLSTIISFFVVKFIFLKKQEEILAEKYGTPYLEYKKLVRF